MKTKTFAGVNAFAKMIAQVEKDTMQACVNTVNIQAAKSRKIAQDETMPRAMTLRNKFSQSSVLFTQCPKSVTRLDDIVSEVGATSRASYLALQETGGTRKPAKGSKLAIYTDAARGGKSRSKTVQREFMRNKVFSKRASSASSLPTKRRRAMRMYEAWKTKGFVGFKDSMFRVVSATKDSATKKIKFVTEQILNLKFSTAQVQEKKWLEPATNQMASQAQAIFNSQMDKI